MTRRYLNKFFPYFPGKYSRVLSLELFDPGLHLWSGDSWLGPANHTWPYGTRLLGESDRCFIKGKLNFEASFFILFYEILQSLCLRHGILVVIKTF